MATPGADAFVGPELDGVEIAKGLARIALVDVARFIGCALRSNDPWKLPCHRR
jgi:hypothetical protein